MKNMTDKKDDTGDPSSTAGATPPQKNGSHLQVVKGSSTSREDHNGHGEKHRDQTTFMGFLKSMISGKSETNLHEALKEFVAADGDDNGTPPSLAPDERTLISNILALRDMRAVDVMIPRADIIALEISTTADELMALLAEKQYSRFPVYRESLDDVVGTIHIKDILIALAQKIPLEVEKLVRDVPIVSPAMHVLDLLLEMKETRRQMALVVDEFGGIDGLVTVGDIMGAIVGEMEDEHEVDDQPQITQTADGTVLADGRVDVDTFESSYGSFLTEEERDEIDTLGGLVFAIAGRVPARGEIVSHDSGLVFEVLDADPRRVHRLRIKNIPKEPANA